MKQKITSLPISEAIEEVSAEKGFDQLTLKTAVEEAVSQAFCKHFQVNMPVTTKLNQNGKFTIQAAKTVVERVEDSLTEIAQSDPIAKDYGLGDSVYVEITSSSIGSKTENITDVFGRMAALIAKQVIRQKMRDAERRLIYEEYKGREGELIHGKVQRVRNGSLIVELGKTEAILPRREIPVREKYKENERVKAVIIEVRLGPKGPQIILSRSHPWFLNRLFEMEITEVFDKTVEIKAIAREAGFRSKVAVSSRDSNVDPVGACVGQKGIRIQTIVRELGGEKIDIVNWVEEPTTFIRNALSPAECERVIVNEATKTAEVIVSDENLSLAIGKNGQNARLAAKLTNWKIDIHSKSEISKDEADKLLKIAFGSTPEEFFASFNIGPETAPILSAAGIVDIAELARIEVAQLAELVGPAPAIIISDEARKRWEEYKSQISDIAEPEDFDKKLKKRKKKREKGEEVVIVEPFALPNGQTVSSEKELVSVLDELPGEELESLLMSDQLKEWMQNIGMKPESIAELMARYR